MSLPPLPAGATLDEELPPLPPGATLDEAPLPEGATLDATPTIEPHSEAIASANAAWVAGPGFTAQDVSDEVDRSDAALVDSAWSASRELSGDDHATTIAIAKQFGVPYEQVRANLKAWKETSEASAHDSKKWIAENRQLFRMISKSPDLGPMVLRRKELGPLVRAIRNAGDYFKDAVTQFNAAMHVPAETLAQQKKSAAGNPDFAPVNPEELDAANTPLTPEQVQERDKSREKRDAPTQALERDDAKAKVLRDDPSLSARAVTLFVQGMETADQLDTARLNTKLMLAQLTGRHDDARELEVEIHDREITQAPRAYGTDSGVMADLSKAVSGSVSTLLVGKESLKGAGVAGGIGAVLGGGAGFALTKTPAGALEGAVEGMKLFGGHGATAGAMLATLDLETGGSFAELRTKKTDKGKLLSTEEAAGGAILVGLANMGLEMVSFGQQTKPFKAGMSAVFKEALERDPTFRRMAAGVAKEWAQSIVTEGGTEGLQNLTQQVAEYFTHTRRKLSGDEVIADVEAGGMGAALFATGGSAFTLATERTADARAEVGDRAVTPLFDLAQDPSTAAAPLEFAQMVADTSAENGGKPLTSVHVDAHAVVRFFQNKGEDGNATNAQVAELLGPEGPAALLEAAAAGGKIEVPVEKVFSSWGRSEVGKALIDDTTTDPRSLTPRQRTEQKVELKQQAQALADTELAKLEKEQALSKSIEQFETQITETGVLEDKSQVRAAGAVLRAFMATTASNFETAVATLWPNLPITVAKGDEKAIGAEEKLNQEKDWSDRIVDAAAKLEAQPEGRTRAGFFDTLTGLFNRRGFDALPQAKPGGVLVALTSTDTKPINDKINHVQTDRLFKALAGQIAAIDEHAGRDGTTFLFRADSKEAADAAVAKWKAGLPEGLNLSLGFGEDSTGAMADLEDQVDVGRAKGRAAEGVAAAPTDAELLAEFPNAPALPAERIGTRLDLKALKEHPELLAAGDVARSPGAVPAEVATAAEKAFSSSGDFARDQFLDQATGGIIFNGRGWEAMGEKAHVAAFDGIGLKGLNEKFTAIGRDQLGMSRREAKAWGRAQGNTLLNAIAEAGHRMGGAGVAFSRLSGDEYAAKSDDLDALKQFAADLIADLADLRFDVTLPDGSKVEVPVGIRWGIGEKTYEQADSDLARRKAEGPGGDGDLPGSGAVDGRAERAHRRGVLEAARLDRPGVAGPNEEGARGQGAAGKVERLPQEPDEKNVPKGYIERKAVEGTVRAFMNKKADLSTVLHEMAHGFLELYGQLAERADAPAHVKENYAAALKWLGVDKRSEITREHHEKWARSFEQYLREGKGPAAALVKLFTKMKLWLTDIYRSLQSVPGSDLNDDARRVFDALLATEDQVEAFRKREGPPIFSTAEEAGVGDEEFAKQVADQREAYDEGSRKVQLQAVKDALRVHEKWWQAGLAKLEAVFADEYEQLPGRRAQRLLEGELSGEPIVLDRAAVEAVIGKARVPGLRTAEKGGVRPSVVAQAAGMASPDAMLAALAGLRPKDKWVQQQAESEMAAQHPGILQDRERLQRDLNDALAAVTERRLLDEDAILRKKDPTLGVTPIEVIKQAAALMVERRPIGRLNVGGALAQERAAANAKNKAAIKGEWQEAGAAARTQHLNAAVHRELLKAEVEVEKLEKLAGQLSKTAARERLGKASREYRDAVDFLLENLGFRGKKESAGLDVTVLQRAVNQLNGDAILIGDPEWLGVLQTVLSSGSLIDKDEPNHKKLTVAEARMVTAALKNLHAGATQRNTILLDGERVEFDQVKDRVLEEIFSTLPPKGPVVPKGTRTPFEKLSHGWNGLDGFLLAVPDMVKDLTGDDQNSMLHRVVVNTMRRSAALEADLMKERITPIIEQFEKMSPEVRAGLDDNVDGSQFFPGHTDAVVAPRKRWEILTMALNAGSESSQQVLTEGRNISIDQVVNALNMLTKEEIDWVNAVHQSVNELRDPAFDLEERMTGLRPRAVEAKPTQLKNGRLTGGYFPLKAEPEASNVGATMFGDEQAAALFDPTFTRPGTAHGHLKSRTGAAYPVTLDPDVLRKHLMQVAHDIAFREAVKSVGRLVMDADVQAALKDRLGAPKTREWLLALKDVGGANVVESNVAEDLLRGFKRNLSSSALSGLGTAAGNFANLAAAVASTDLKARHLASATLDVITNFRKSRDEANALSGVFRSGDTKLVEDLNRELTSLTAGSVERGLGWVREASFAAMKGVDTLVTTAVWRGAMQQATSAGMPQAEAIRWADDLMLRVQPSTSPFERARILRDKGWIGSIAMFYSYLNVAYRAQHRLAAPLRTQAFQDAKPMEKVKLAGRVAGRLAAFYFAFQVLGELGMGRGPDDGDRDDDDPDNKLLKWRNYLARKMVAAPLSTIPIVPLASMWESAVLKKPVMNTRADPFSNALLQLGKATSTAVDAATGDGDVGKALKESSRALSLLIGAPERLLETTGGYALDITWGDREVKGPGHLVSGLIYGERDGQPDNLFTLLDDAFWE